MMKSITRTAWLRIEHGQAIICAWCPDKIEAEARAARASLPVSHGICLECKSRQLSDVTADSFGPVAKPICVASSRTAPGVTTPAAVSTPTGTAVRITFIPLWQVAEVCQLSCDRIEALRPEHWVRDRDWSQLPHGMQIRENSLADLVGEFSVSGELNAARLLWCWLVDRTEERIAAGSGAPDGPSVKSAARVNAAPARMLNEHWLNRWERAQS